MTKPVLLWFRQDLRLGDNPALHAAAHAGPIVAIYILEDSLPWGMGGASRWWLHHSLCALADDLRKHNIKLILRRGAASHILPEFIHTHKIKQVFWNRLYEPAAIARDTELKNNLKARGVDVQSFNASLLFEPWEIKNQSGNPFKVFTPFAKACLAAPPPPQPLPLPKALTGAAIAGGDNLENWRLLPTKPNWASGFNQWQCGEKAAQQRLYRFFENALGHYSQGRDRPDCDFTSGLSPYLHFGEISPRQIFYATRHAETREINLTGQAHKFISEILWREFSYSQLFAFPDLPEKPLNTPYENFPWQKDEMILQKWQRGQTGIPIVDAGMRQLWQTGWMHNRVRMIVASLLVKNLLQPWQDGAKWFWDCLLDADLASNSASWQWVAGCGADAAPYYRIFNPVLQGQRFDPEGLYVKRYVPELGKLPASLIHAPWALDAATLKAAGVVLGNNYPKPIVDLKHSRMRALEALARIKVKKTE